MSKSGGGRGEYDVNVQSQIEPFFQYFLMRELQTGITLTSAVAVNENEIEVSAAHGFVAAPNEMIVIQEGNYMSQYLVLSVLSNVVTISGLTDLPFTTDAKVVRGNKNLNTNGSLATPEEASFKFYDAANNTIPIDIATVVMHMVHPTAGDDSAFGDQTALVAPAYFRKIDGQLSNLGFYKNNGDFRNYGAEVIYTDKAGGGAHSTSIIFHLIDSFTKEIRLDAKLNDEVYFYNPGLLSGLTTFFISILGSLTSGE